MEIRKVDYGIANNFGNYIEVNKHLFKYPHLLHPVLEHEHAHTTDWFSMKDFKLDFTHNRKLNTWDMLKFMVRHPSSLTQLLPFYYTRKKGFVYDVNLLIMYLIMGFVFFGTIYLGATYL